MKKRILSIFICVFAVIVLSVGCGIAFLFTPASFNEGNAECLFVVPHGTSVMTVAKKLKEERLVRSEYAAYVYFRVSHLQLLAGAYRLSANMSPVEICRYLQSGKQEYLKVTVPEGMTLSKTAHLLEQHHVISADDFVAAAQDPTLLKKYGIPSATAEGFLFPETYFFSYNESAETVLDKLIKTFFTKTADIPHFPVDPQKRYETVILASIIEREYRVPEEAAKIAGVFINRIKIGMGLQSCATIEYILTEIQHKPHPERLLKSDLKIDSPYNTYKWRGLPPSPISNPGLNALYAACNPETHPYFYFRLENPAQGTHVFTKTLNEHARYGALILKKSAKR